MNLKYKIGASIATAAFLGAILTGSAFAADNTCKIKGNGVGSTNKCKIQVEKNKVVIQENNAFVKNFVGVSTDTGGNSANGNTTGGGSEVKVKTGDATATVTITNTVNTSTINQ